MQPTPDNRRYPSDRVPADLSDSHVTVPDEAWLEYLDPEFRDRAPWIERTDEGDFRVFEGKRTPIMALETWRVGSRRISRSTFAARRSTRPGAWDPAERLKDMDIDGVDAEVLYFGGPLNSSDQALRLNSVRGYNRWLSDFASYAPDGCWESRRSPSTRLSWRWRRSTGRRGSPASPSGYIPLFPAEGDYGDTRWNPVWEAFKETGLPIGLHSGGRRPGTPDSRLYGAPRFMSGIDHQARGRVGLRADPRSGHAAPPGVEVRGGRGSDRLDVVLPVLLRPSMGKAQVLDQERAERTAQRLFPPAGLRHLHGGPGGLRERHHIGIDNIMWASDYPHSETTWPNSKSLTDEWFTQYGDEDKAKILWENAPSCTGSSERRIGAPFSLPGSGSRRLRWLSSSIALPDGPTICVGNCGRFVRRCRTVPDSERRPPCA